MRVSQNRIPVFVSVFLGAGLFLSGGCSHYKQESGTKTEFNDATGRFETSSYVSAGFSTEKQQKPSVPIKEKDLKKAQEK